MASSRMTKDQLRDALIEVGVKTPVKSKKADLVKLYREHVLGEKVEVVTPNDSLIGGFSSDEEEPMPLDTSYINRETDLKNLTNDEIFFKLKELGETVGPILDSTRSIYEKRLSRVLNDEEGKDISAFSADEGEDEKEKETDTTDEYESHNEQMRGSAYNEQIIDGGSLKTMNTFHEKTEESNGTVTRTRKAQSVRTYTAEAFHGKSFVPPPPKKRSYALVVGGIVVIILLIAAAVVLFDFAKTGPELKEAVLGKESAKPVQT